MVTLHQSGNPDAEVYLMTNVLLASAMALRYGKSQETAVKRAAKAMRDQTKLDGLKSISRTILKANPSEIRNLIKRLHQSMLWEGLLNTEIGAYNEPNQASAVLHIP